MTRTNRFDATMRAWANDPPIPRLDPITQRVASLEPRELPRAIAAMTTDEIEHLLSETVRAE